MILPDYLITMPGSAPAILTDVFSSFK